MADSQPELDAPEMGTEIPEQEPAQSSPSMASLSQVAAGPSVSTDSDRGARKFRVGLVVSDKMDKTITIAIQRQVVHLHRRKFKAWLNDEALNKGNCSLNAACLERQFVRLKRCTGALGSGGDNLAVFVQKRAARGRHLCSDDERHFA